MLTLILSESSLFVYPYKMIIKTCGATKLLLSIPSILELAGSLSMSIRAVMYTRGSFIFPGSQPFPQRSFSEEVAVLDSCFSNLTSSGSKAHVICSPRESCAESEVNDKWEPVYTLKMCMTGLDKKRASVFYKTRSSSATKMTSVSGIKNILPDSHIEDFEFDPCGYSMNAIEGAAISTIHVTPEDGFSFASFEAAGYNLSDLIERVLASFKPAEFSITMHAADVTSDKHVLECPYLDLKIYNCLGNCYQGLDNGGYVVYLMKE